MYVLFSAYISVSGIMLVFQCVVDVKDTRYRNLKPWQINVVCFTLNVGVKIASHTYVAQHGYRCIDI